MSTTTLFEIEKVSKNISLPRETISILDEVSFKVYPRQSIAITGVSGSGKSTLLSLLCGLDIPTKGKIYFEDKALNVLSNNELAEFRLQNIGYVFQDFQLIPHLTVLENVMLPLELQNFDPSDCRERACSWLQEVDMLAHKDKYVTVLSGGEKQRVAIARACVNHPKILIADEPTGQLDNKTANNIINLIFEKAREQHISFIVATHDERVYQQCDRKLEIISGKIHE